MTPAPVGPRGLHTDSKRRPIFAAAALLAVALTAGCSSSVYEATRVAPPKPSASSSAPGSSTSAPPAASTNAGQCLASYAPLASLPAPRRGSGSTLAAIYKRGYLKAGVSADTLLLGARNPLKAGGPIEGFDIDMLRAVSQALFGSPDKIDYTVINTAQRIPDLQDGTVDIVARAMTINCDRWNGTQRDSKGNRLQVAFSSAYYVAGQKLLVPKGSPITTPAQLSGRKVCAPTGSTSLTEIAALVPKVVPVQADTHTGCLVLFQQGKVDAITGDDAILAGLAKQDPYATVVGKAFTKEPYGLAMGYGKTDLVRFVNTVLATMHRDGSWTASYNRWLKPALKVAATQPTPVYGRKP